MHRPPVVQQGTADVDVIFLNAAAGPKISDLSQSGGDAPLLGGDWYRQTAPCCALQLEWDHLCGPLGGWRDCRKDCRSRTRLTSYTADLFPFPISIRWDSYRDRGSSLTKPMEEKKKRKNTDMYRSTERLQRQKIHCSQFTHKPSLPQRQKCQSSSSLNRLCCSPHVSKLLLGFTCSDCQTQ